MAIRNPSLLQATNRGVLSRRLSSTRVCGGVVDQERDYLIHHPYRLRLCRRFQDVVGPVVAYLNHESAHRIPPEVIHESEVFRSWILPYQLVELIFELDRDVRVPIKLGAATVDLEIVV